MTVDISKGVALLDERLPGWWREDHEPAIDLNELDMEGNCVVYQLKGSYWPGLKELGVSGKGIKLGFYVPSKFAGFDNWDAESEYYDKLTAAWRILIQSRRDAARETTL